MAQDYSGLIIIGGLGVAGYLLYQKGTLQQWFPSLFTASQPSGTSQSPSQSTASGTYRGVTLLPSNILTTATQQAQIDQALAQGFSVAQVQSLISQQLQAYQQCGSTAGSAPGTAQTPQSQYGVWNPNQGCVVNIPPVTSTPTPTPVFADPCAGAPINSFLAAVDSGVWTPTMTAAANAVGMSTACQNELIQQANNIAQLIQSGESLATGLTGLGARNRVNRSFIHGRGAYRLRRAV